MLISFDGKVALITGAAMGMGLAAAKAFAESGAAIVLVDYNEAALEMAANGLKAVGHQVLALRCDVSDESAVADAVAKTVSTFGRLDAAFNNAGVQAPESEVMNLPNEDYERVMAINLRGVWNCMKHELRQMRAQGSGAIVNCASAGGLVGVSLLGAYIGSKHGVIGLTKTAGLENASHGVRVNAVCPGTIDTPMVAAMIDERPQFRDEINKRCPIGRLGRSEEVASAVLFLCSDAASFVVGHALAVDGGQTAE